MEIVKTVEIKKFNADLKVGTPIKVTYFPSRVMEESDYGIVTKNLGNLLVYTAYKSNSISQFEIEPDRVGSNVKIEVGIWNFEGGE